MSLTGIGSKKKRGTRTWEYEDSQRASRILRAGRKLRGLSQKTMADVLEISQAAYSKLEAGQTLVTAIQWYRLCSALDINPQLAFLGGFIDGMTSSKIVTPYPEHRFQVGKQYTRIAHSRVRVSVPYLQFFKNALGEQALDEYLEKQGFDPDYFCVLDNPLNVQFNLDIAADLMSKGLLKKSNMHLIAEYVSMPRIHGALLPCYEKKAGLELVKKLVAKISFYESNFRYEIEEERNGKLTILATPETHLKDFRYRSEILGNFLNEYRRLFLEYFSTLTGSTRAVVNAKGEAGFSKCRFQVSFEK